MWSVTVHWRIQGVKGAMPPICQKSRLASAVFTTWSIYASAVLGIVILSVCLFVCLSITRVLCDETKEHTAHILIPHETVINSFLIPTEVGGRCPRPPEKHWLPSAYKVWTVRASEKCSIIANRKSTTCFPTSCRWSAYVTPNSPKGWLEKQIYHFCE